MQYMSTQPYKIKSILKQFSVNTLGPTKFLSLIQAGFISLVPGGIFDINNFAARGQK